MRSDHGNTVEWKTAAARVRARSCGVSHFVTIGVVATLLAARTAHADDHGPDAVDGIGVLGIARHAELYGDATYEHADGSDAIALVPGARIAIGDARVPRGPRSRSATGCNPARSRSAT